MGVSTAIPSGEGKTSQREYLGGARADFVANLSRRKAELTTALSELRDEPTSKRAQNDLRRRVHALLTGAKLLRFTHLCEELDTVEHRLGDATAKGEATAADCDMIEGVFGRLSALAWGQPNASPKPSPARADTDARTRAPISVLLVGPQAYGDALSIPAEDGHGEPTQVFEVEQTLEIGTALDLTKAMAPDIVVIDADLAGATAIIEDLLGDPLTEGTPLLAIGRFVKMEDAAKLAALGVARTLVKPVASGELRRACGDVASSYVKREIVREPLGEMNLDQLGNKLAEEIRRALCDGADPKSRAGRVNLGEGTEVLAALWASLAKIRDVVTIKSGGKMRFTSGGPEGALPMVGTTVDEMRAAFRPARATENATLKGRTVLVVDDDAAIAWFLAGVFKAAGATVYDARDGERAFEIAKFRQPDLVVSDILMPKMDGFALCRALKRDLVLRDVPVILLSWKEDLLQRVRELGVDADGYLRKEASASVLVLRAKELLRERNRVAERIATGSEVRGRLDGLTIYSLLRMVCTERPSSTLTVRDAEHLYEIEIRKGRPVRATRTTTEGTFERGHDVIAALLAVGDGRFTVSPPREDSEVGIVRHDFDGELSDLVIGVVASARASQRLVMGENLARLALVEFDKDRFPKHLAVSTEPARRMLGALSSGVSPRQMIVEGKVAPRLLEDLLVDAAAHGLIVEVTDVDGVDKLPHAIAHEVEVLRGDRKTEPIASISLQLPGDSPMPAPPIDIAMPSSATVLQIALGLPVYEPSVLPGMVVPNELGQNEDSIFGASRSSTEVASESPHDFSMVTTPDDQPASPLVSASNITDDPREEAWFAAAPTVPAEQESVVDLTTRRAPSPLPSLSFEPQALTNTPTPSVLPPPKGTVPLLTLGSLHPPPVNELQRLKTPTPHPIASFESDKPKSKSRRDDSPRPREVTPSAPFVDRKKYPLPSAFLAQPEPPKKDKKLGMWLAFAAAGLVFALWARWSRERTPVAEESVATQATSQPVDAAAAATPPVEEAMADGTATPLKDQAPDKVFEELPLRESDKVKKGQGVLEVVTGRSDTVYVDGKALGSGPIVSVPLKAKSEPYEVKIKMRDEERVRFVAVKEGRLHRMRVAPPWSR